MKYYMISLLCLVMVSSACNRVKSSAKDTINKGGELVGKTATEFAEGITEGVDRALDCDIILSQELQEMGLKTGTFAIENNKKGGSDNVLSLYTIFNQAFEGQIKATTFTKKGLESGRTLQQVKAEQGETAYLTFTFDTKTRIETKSQIKLELVANE